MQRSFSLFFIYLIFISLPVLAQKPGAVISGKVLDENEHSLSGVSILILGQEKGITSNDSGHFMLRVPAEKAFALVFTYAGYKAYQQNFILNEGEKEFVTIRLEPGSQVMEQVTIKDQRDRTETGLIRPNPKLALHLPTPVTGVESMIKTIVGSNNELTSQYNVRGGNYDENLVYVNDFEIFRPYLVQSGQQEGLSFINPEMVKNINFYNGGFQAKYGDKLSSVLDIQYNTPRKFGGSAYVSMLEQGLHVEGSDKKFSYIIGLRNKSNRNILSRQETQGIYIPSSSDIQVLLHEKLSDRWQAELLANLSQTRFSLYPQSSQLTSSVFSPLFTRNLGLDITFNGNEQDAYSTGMIGISTTYQPNKNLRLKFLASRFEDREQENEDITGIYLFGDRDFDKRSTTFGLIVNPLGAGLYQNYIRDQLQITDYTFSHRGNFTFGNQVLQWGIGYNHTIISDHIQEWQYQDSAGYSLPNNPNVLLLNHVQHSGIQLQVHKFSGFVQDNMAFSKNGNNYTLQAGLRYYYNDLNHEWLISPRAGASWKPNWKRDIIFKASAGIYDQPPFYRELRSYDGTLNTHVKAQKSFQAVTGFDYSFIGMGRPLRLSTEAYYKYLWDADPYDIDNVRIRYFGNNQAKAYAEGIELRLFGELVKDAESWISIGVMHTMENIENDFYTSYKFDSLNHVFDSSRLQRGWLRRPTDRLLTIGMFFQDYLATNKNFKVYLNTLYGSNLPYNIPGSIQYRNALTIPAYLRIDLGFSALLLDAEKTNRRSHSPFRNFNNIWATLEVFNLIDRANTISYLLIKDFQNNVYTIPNRLTPRLINFKLVARW